MHSHLRGHPSLIQATKRLAELNPDQFEVYYEHRTSTKIDSKDQEIDTLSRSEDVGLAIRIIKDGKLGFSYTTSLENNAIHKAVETAFEISQYMPEDKNVGLHALGNAVYPSVDNFDSHGLDVPLSEKILLAKSLEAQCRKADSRITAVRLASIYESCLETILVDSNGEHLQHKSTGYSASVTCKAESGGESQMGSEFAFSNYLDALPIQSVALLSAQWAVELLGSTSAPTMKCPAILRNSVMADLLEFLSDSFSAEQMDKGRSMLAGKQGQLVFSDAVTVINDGLMPGGMGTTPFDGEGVPSKKTVLIDGGFLQGTLYDSYYARKNDAEPTGSALRGIKAPPSIGVSNFYLKGGRKTYETLFDGISKGILITDLMGLHTANPVTGDFSLGASGILIEGGKLTRPVRGFAVAGNVMELFRRITDISSDLKFFGRIGAPSVRLSEISVGGI
ncbi:MAG: TldD/PmbA family protein [Bdellovibrionia bacterium]